MTSKKIFSYILSVVFVGISILIITGILNFIGPKIILLGMIIIGIIGLFSLVIYIIAEEIYRLLLIIRLILK